ncbi:MAG: hypothetical protein E4H44_06550 [Candidatus Aminicenantes bacterium]|nr:MAG: hypothetical protein E4H44_06550 [Candidatus Aminicenantes bacterium]
MPSCCTCEVNPIFGSPSAARWLGPDGEKYCSMHFINRFGHSEPLVLIEDYEPPAIATKPKKRAKKTKAPTTVEA